MPALKEVAIVWKGLGPVRTPGKIDKPLHDAGLWRVGRDEKARSVVASSRDPPLEGVRRLASGCRF